MIRNILGVGLTFFCLVCRTQNFSAIYGFPDVNTSSGTTDPSPTPTVNGLILGSFKAFGTPANPSASGRFAFSNWPQGGLDGVDSYSLFTGALSALNYFEVSISVVPGYTLNLTSISFEVRRSTTGIRNYCVRSSADNYSNDLAASTGTNAKLAVIPTNIFFWKFDSVSTSSDQKGSMVFPGASFSAVTGSISFRFYAWNSEAAGGSFSIDDVMFQGAVSDSSSFYSGLNDTNKSETVNALSLFFPNPLDGSCLHMREYQNLNAVEIRNNLGGVERKFLSAEINDGGEIDLSGLQTGVYFLVSYSQQGKRVDRLVLR